MAGRLQRPSRIRSLRKWMKNMDGNEIDEDLRTRNEDESRRTKPHRLCGLATQSCSASSGTCICSIESGACQEVAQSTLRCATMRPWWTYVRVVQEAWCRSCLASGDVNGSAKVSSFSNSLAKMCASSAFSSYFETVASPPFAHRIDVSSLSKAKMNKGFSSFLRNRGFHSVPSWRAVESLGCRTRGFSSQSEVAGKEALQRARLTWESQNAGKKKSEAMLMYLVAMVTAMVGATYAAVPLYRKFCQATGYGGTVQRRETVEEKIARHKAEESAAESRELVVQFNADVADGMPWKFTPCQRELRVSPGQSTLAFYTAENISSTPITGVSTYNVTPMKAGLYFNKIQCFCFEEQRLLPGEKIDMPVFFFIDPEFATDPNMKGINNLILSYTFFKVEEAPQGASQPA